MFLTLFHSAIRRQNSMAIQFKGETLDDDVVEKTLKRTGEKSVS